MIFINGLQIKPTIFPDKTSQIWKIPNQCLEKETACIEWEFENEAEFIHLAQIKDLMYKMDINCVLYMPYLPYDRQDKEITNETTFALISFSRLLNLLDFENVICLDPHSDVAGRFINNFIAKTPEDYINPCIKSTEATLLAFPDQGAQKRYVDKFTLGAIYGLKKRNEKTGIITSYEVIGKPEGHRILIIDDICDGGATFCMLANKLVEMKVLEINLYVTHGIFSRGTQILRDAGIKRIFTYKGEV